MIWTLAYATTGPCLVKWIPPLLIVCACAHVLCWEVMIICPKHKLYKCPKVPLESQTNQHSTHEGSWWITFFLLIFFFLLVPLLRLCCCSSKKFGEANLDACNSWRQLFQPFSEAYSWHLHVTMLHFSFIFAKFIIINIAHFWNYRGLLRIFWLSKQRDHQLFWDLGGLLSPP